MTDRTADPRGPTATEPTVVILDDEATVAVEAAGRIAAVLADAVATRGRADWATTGGSMAPAIYRRLAAAPLREAVPWEAVHAWWGDDRFVPRDHPLSNVQPFDDILLAIARTEGGQVGRGTMGAARPVPIPLDHVHPFPTSAAIGRSLGAAWCASQLADELRVSGPRLVDGLPAFDLVLLGVGPDGHVLSVFPGSDAFDADDPAVAVPAPTHVEPHVERVTLHPGVLAVARAILVVVAGAAKAGMLRDVLRGELDARRLPAQLARNERATWILDAAAAADLDLPGG